MKVGRKMSHPVGLAKIWLQQVKVETFCLLPPRRQVRYSATLQIKSVVEETCLTLQAVDIS
jgi:hypothetical protein